MGLRRPRFEGESQNREINISPMIDVMFILLIFFIVTMAFSENSALKIERPKSSQNINESGRALKIFVESDGRIFAGGAYASLDMVKILAKNCAEKSAIIDADSKLEISALVEIMDACAEGGISKIFISSQAKRGGEK